MYGRRDVLILVDTSDQRSATERREVLLAADECLWQDSVTIVHAACDKCEHKTQRLHDVG